MSAIRLDDELAAGWRRRSETEDGNGSRADAQGGGGRVRLAASEVHSAQHGEERAAPATQDGPEAAHVTARAEETRDQHRVLQDVHRRDAAVHVAGLPNPSSQVDTPTAGEIRR